MSKRTMIIMAVVAVAAIAALAFFLRARRTARLAAEAKDALAKAVNPDANTASVTDTAASSGDEGGSVA